MGEQDSIMSLPKEIAKKVRNLFADINSLSFSSGTKHPVTPVGVFKNVWYHDKMQANALYKCDVCGYFVSDEETKRKELVFACDPGKCLCQKPYLAGLNLHKVCDLCNDMYRAVYVNYGMKNRNYFKDLDEDEREARAPRRNWP
jgi:hypothetical protein